MRLAPSSRLVATLALTLVSGGFLLQADGASGEPAPAPSGAYIADPAHTSLTWRISHFGLSNYTARFTGISAQLAWDAEQPTKSALTVEIDPKSIRTDFPFPDKEDFDKKIGTDPAFLAGKPISFRSTALKVTGKNKGTVTGALTFRGETHPATLDVTFNGSMAQHPMEKVAKLGFSADAVIHRAAWGLDFAPGALGDEVRLHIETEFVPAK